MIQRIFFMLMVAFFITACSEQGAEQAPQKKPEQTPEQVRLENPGAVRVTLKPVRGKAILCGAVLEPEAVKTQ